MKIVICGSVDFSPQIAAAAAFLGERGHEVTVPLLTQKIMDGEVGYEDFLQEKADRGDGVFRRAESGSLIRRYYHLIEKADAVLIVNEEKKGIAGYIGANTFLEIGFAHALDKKIYLLNPPADGNYNDELAEISPVIINGDLKLIG
ncbi:MAG: hypothetical protein PHG95_03995 [Patescibacteria group bacterium]|nr:hypothetical protein [Patescibacteria group bacterium]